jgi:toxin ParE1/3/4
MTRLLVQRHAMRDLAEARAYYRKEAPHMVADFAMTVDIELLHIRRNPTTGSPRYGLQIGFAGLRSWTVRKFPYVIFYVPQDDCVLVIRVLHQATDIPAHLGP